MSPEERKALWKKLESEYTPWRHYETNTFLGQGRMWQKQTHVYRWPFYYIDYHCSEGHLIADELAHTRQKGVILGPFLGFPHKNEVVNQGVESAAILHEAGVKLAIMTDLPAMHTSNLVVCAGMCHKAGLPLVEAMRAVTSNAAEILDLDDRIGSIEIGKDADITIFDKNPIQEMTAHCLATIIDGEVVHLV